MIFSKQLLVLNIVFYSLFLSSMEKDRTLYAEIRAAEYDYENNYDINYHEGIFSFSASFDTNWERSDNAPQERVDVESQAQRDFAENSLRESMAEAHTMQQQNAYDHVNNSEQYTQTAFNDYTNEIQTNKIAQIADCYYKPHIDVLDVITKNLESNIYRQNLEQAGIHFKEEWNKHFFGNTELKKQYKFIEALLDGSIEKLLNEIHKGNLDSAEKAFEELKKLWPWKHKSCLFNGDQCSTEREFVNFLGSDIAQIAESILVTRKDYIDKYLSSKHFERGLRYYYNLQLNGNKNELLYERNALISNYKKFNNEAYRPHIAVLNAIIDDPLTDIFRNIKNGDLPSATKALNNLKMQSLFHFEANNFIDMNEAKKDMISHYGIDLLDAAEKCFASRYDQINLRNKKIDSSENIISLSSNNQNTINHVSSALANNIIITPEFHQRIVGRLETLDDSCMEGALTYIDVLSNLLQERSVGAEMRGEFFTVGIEAYTLLQNYDANQNQCIVGQQDFNIEIINARKDALNNVAHNPFEFRGQSYTLHPEVTEMLRSYGINSKPFTYCVGNEVQQQLRAEFTSILNEAAKISLNESTQPLVDMVITCTYVGNVYSQENNLEKAFNLADCAWAALDCAKRVCESGIDLTKKHLPEMVEGVVEGCINAICNTVNIVMHPRKTIENIVESISHLGNCLIKLAVSIDDPEDIYLTPEIKEMKAELRQEIMQDIIDGASQITVKDATALVTEQIVTGKLFCFGMSCINHYATPSMTQLIKLGKSVKDKVTDKTQKLISPVFQKVIDKLNNCTEIERVAVTAEGTNITVSTVQKDAKILQSMDKVKSDGFSQKPKKISSTIDVTKKVQQRFHKNKPLLEQLEKKVEELAKNTSKDKVGKILEKTHVAKITELDIKTENFYNKIRETTTDIEVICENTGISTEVIECVKKHVFLEEHILRGAQEKFFPDADMAAAWQRLIDNTYVYSDLKMLQHEYAEALIMRGLEIAYDDAHYIVNEVYDWNNLL